MKAVLSLFIMFFLLAGAAMAAERNSATVPAAEVDNVFDIANEEYKAGNYEDAVRLYEGLLAGTELRTADIYYNLGNAYFKLGQYGNATAAYKRALRLTPRDRDIEANLRLVQNVARDKIDRPKSTEMLRELLFFHYGLSRAESEAVFLCAYSITASLACIHLFWKPRALRWLLGVSLLVTGAFGVSTAAHAYHAANPREAVVIAEEAPVHTGPGERYLVSFSLHDGAELEVIAHENGWYQVELSDGRRGWLRESHAGII
jgi:tetratricopeptide (TPR) repeat protein